jgi:integrase
MRRAHRVPLARQTLAILKDLKTITGELRWLFPSVSSVLRPISENTVNTALRRTGYAKDEMCGHGFRAMAATRLNVMGRWNRDAIERQLGHQEEDDVRRAYMHAAEFWSARVEMMQVWADYLGELRAGTGVISLSSPQVAHR